VPYVLELRTARRYDDGSVNLELRIVLERLVYLRRIREHVTAAFGPARSPRERLHNRELTRHVAARLDIEPSPALGRDVIQAMRAHGWRHVRHARVAWWKGIRRL
jgi:hypothetical protein